MGNDSDYQRHQSTGTGSEPSMTRIIGIAGLILFFLIVLPSILPNLSFSDMETGSCSGTGEFYTVDNESALDAEVDSQGHYYVAGYSTSLELQHEITVDEVKTGYIAKFQPNGLLDWTVFFETIGSGYSMSLKVDTEDNLLVLMRSQGLTGWMLRKLSNSGNLMWEQDVSSQLMPFIEIDPVDNSIVLFSVDDEFIISKFSSQGSAFWKTDPSPILELDFMSMQMIGSDILIAYHAYSESNERQFKLNKYNSEGQLIWDISRKDSFFTHVYSVQIDDQNNIIVVGEHSGEFPVIATPINPQSGETDVFIMSYSDEGILNWLTFVGGSKSETLIKVLYLENDSIAVTGYTISDDFPTVFADQNELVGASNSFFTQVSTEGEIVYSTFFEPDPFWNSYSPSYAISTGEKTFRLIHTSYEFGNDTGNIDYENATQKIQIVDVNLENQSMVIQFLGGSQDDILMGIIALENNEALIFGSTLSSDFPGSDVSSRFGISDSFVLKIDENNQVLWSQIFGGSGYEQEISVCED